MDGKLERLREAAGPWNEYRGTKAITSRFLIGGVIFLLLGSLFFIKAMGEDRGCSKFLFIVFPLAGIAMIAFSLKGNRETKELKDKLDEVEPDKLKLLEEVVDELENSNPKKEDDVFAFYHLEGEGNRKGKIHWRAKIYDDYLAILRKPKREIHFPDRSKFRIVKGEKAYMSKDYYAKTSFGGKRHKICISPEDFEKYSRSLEPEDGYRNKK